MIDPVCGMEIDEAKAAGTSKYNDKTFYFCSVHCKEKFASDPKAYINRSTESRVNNVGHRTKPKVTALTGYDNGADLVRLDVPIVGMNCASCAVTIEKSISSLPGVGQAKVNFANEKATVAFDPKITDAGQITERVKSAGYQVGGATTRIGIKGMSCASCVNRIEKALLSTPGVLDVSVNLSTEEARISYLPELTDLKKLEKAIEATGYQAVLLSEEIPEDTERLQRQRDYKKLLWKLVFSAALCLPILMISFPAVFTFLQPLSERVRWSILFVLTIPVIAYPGAQFYIGAWKALRHRSADMNTLIAVGTGAAFIYSTLATVSISTQLR